MTTEQAQQVLDELQGVRPKVLNGEAKRLFEAIMKIADERDELKEITKKQEQKISSLNQIHNYDIKMIDEVKGEAVKLYNTIDDKDKIIDLMAKMLNNHDVDEDICRQMGKKENCNEFTNKENCKDCIKQYFENKVKHKNLLKYQKKNDKIK